MCILRYLPRKRSVGVEDGAGVVIDAGGAAFEKGSDERDFVFFRDLREFSVVGPGNGFGEIKKIARLRCGRNIRREKVRACR